MKSLGIITGRRSVSVIFGGFRCSRRPATGGGGGLLTERVTLCACGRCPALNYYDEKLGVVGDEHFVPLCADAKITPAANRVVSAHFARGRVSLRLRSLAETRAARLSKRVGDF